MARFLLVSADVAVGDDGAQDGGEVGQHAGGVVQRHSIVLTEAKPVGEVQHEDS